MGTNSYLVRQKPRLVRDAFHICKISAGWKPVFQNSECADLEEVEFIEGKVSWNGNDVVHDYYGSVSDIRKLLETGEYEIMDEYGDTSDGDGPYTIDSLIAWGEHEHNYRDENTMYSAYGYKDAEGFTFHRQYFC